MTYKDDAKASRREKMGHYADGGEVERRILFDATPMNQSAKSANERVKAGFDGLNEENSIQSEVGHYRTRLNRHGYKANPIV